MTPPLDAATLDRWRAYWTAHPVLFVALVAVGLAAVIAYHAPHFRR